MNTSTQGFVDFTPATLRLSTSRQLERYCGTATDRAQAWAHLSSEDLRRRAVGAANERDGSELWGLAEAFVTLHGAAGAKISANTMRAYRRGVEDLLIAWSGENLLRPSRDAAALWIRRLEAAGKSESTIRVKLAAARILYKALRWAGATAAEPFCDAKPARDKTAAWDKRWPYLPGELEALLSVAGTVDRAMVLLGAHAGLRASEMTALAWDDVDLPGRILTVAAGKGGKRRRVVMSNTLAAALAALQRGEAKVLPFQDGRARARMRRLCAWANVAYKGLHALRHSAGTRLASERDLRAAAEHLGHSSIETARVYAKWDNRSLQASVGAW